MPARSTRDDHEGSLLPGAADRAGPTGGWIDRLKTPVLAIAAGGGGDLLAAVMAVSALGIAVDGPDAAGVHFASWSWDRVLFDPRPGPRSRDDFDGIYAVGQHNAIITGMTSSRPPGLSTLPLTCDELGIHVALLEATGGAVGVEQQLLELITVLGIRSVVVADVGGDILAQGDEPGLRSPLADSVVLAACASLPVPAVVVVVGPGTDGELSASELRIQSERAGQLGTAIVRPEDVRGLHDVFDRHPSESSALVAAAASGMKGLVEMREQGITFELGPAATEVLAFTVTGALSVNRIARTLIGSRSLDEVEQVLRSLSAPSELERERQRLQRPVPTTPERLDAALDLLPDHAISGQARGADLMTLRRVLELLELDGVVPAELANALDRRYPNARSGQLLRLDLVLEHANP